MTLRRTPRQVARARFERLVPPLLFGAVVLVPIQAWIEAMDKGGWPGGVAGYVAWMAREFSPAGLADGVPVNHLWFIVYIAAYSIVTILLWRRPGLIERLGDALQRVLKGPWLLVLPILYLSAIRLFLFPHFGITNMLHWDWYNHALSLAAFVFGFCIVGRESVWRDMERYRWLALGLAAVALPIMMVQVWHPGAPGLLGRAQGLRLWRGSMGDHRRHPGLRLAPSAAGARRAGAELSDPGHLPPVSGAPDDPGRRRLDHPARRPAGRAGGAVPGRRDLLGQPGRL